LNYIDIVRESRTLAFVQTVIETPLFQKQAEKIWSEDERLSFIDWIAQNPLSGDVIPGADGAHKVRWSIAGKGKRGGVCVIYFNLTEQGTVVLITLYQKGDQDTISASDIQKAV
jgi:mRNA-degrading endonuclease RelE of RelBE toxin-antitoxin system